MERLSWPGHYRLRDAHGIWKVKSIWKPEGKGWGYCQCEVVTRGDKAWVERGWVELDEGEQVWGPLVTPGNRSA